MADGVVVEEGVGAEEEEVEGVEGVEEKDSTNTRMACTLQKLSPNSCKILGNNLVQLLMTPTVGEAVGVLDQRPITTKRLL